jgi:hypothetical protein
VYRIRSTGCCAADTPPTQCPPDRVAAQLKLIMAYVEPPPHPHMDNQIIGMRHHSALRDMNGVVHILTQQFQRRTRDSRSMHTAGAVLRSQLVAASCSTLTTMMPVLLCTRVAGPLYVYTLTDCPR